MVTVDAKVNSTVEPDTATDDTLRDTPPTVTAKSDAPAVVADNASEYVKITFVPAAFTAADENVGATPSTVELFVTDVADNDAASFPAESWTALESFPAVGSVYATVTVSPCATADPKVNSTVEPDTTTDDTLRDTPPTVTAKSDAAAVVADNASE